MSSGLHLQLITSFWVISWMFVCTVQRGKLTREMRLFSIDQAHITHYPVNMVSQMRTQTKQEFTGKTSTVPWEHTMALFHCFHAWGLLCAVFNVRSSLRWFSFFRILADANSYMWHADNYSIQRFYMTLRCSGGRLFICNVTAAPSCVDSEKQKLKL